MKKIIYLDNNSTTQVDQRVLDEMMPCFTENFGNASSATHAMGWYAEELVDIARERIAKSINAKPEEIFFTSGATEANNLAISGYLKEENLNILFSATEHRSVIEPILNRSKKAKKLETEQDGEVQVKTLRAEFEEDSKNLICIGLANNEIGTINKIKELREAGKEDDFFHCDATQALGKIPINVKDLNIDSLSISAHKAHGPKGIGALYVKSKRIKEISAQIFGGGQEEDLRSGTLNVPGIVGFGKAAELASEELIKNQKHLNNLTELFYS